ncbi:MAG: gliding motility-associated C-terminal domain-containing protein [Flavobacteriales bacterium]|nr:gliding motility-associated C-terminal domain-containing protein [Flavobacteriales bacterium]
MNAKTNFIFVILIIASPILLAQNLVPNPSFEDTISCPVYNSNLTDCAEWYSPIGTTPDYFNSCGIGDVGVPNNFNGYQLPRTGNAYCGMYVGNPGLDWLEYIQVQLKNPMIIGNTYEFKMYVNLADKSKYTTDAIGALFSAFPVMPFSSIIIQTPQVLNTPGNFITDNHGWTLIKQTFIADSVYKYVTIGNFFSYVNTSLLITGFNSPRPPYFYIDDVSLVPVNLLCLGDSISLVSEGDSLFAWAESSNPGIIISNDTILKVSPVVNTTYYDYSNNLTTEFIVYVYDNVNLGNDTILCSGIVLPFDVTTPNTTYLWSDGSNNPTFDITESGTYWVEATNSCGISSDTINVIYNSFPLELGNDTTLCLGQNIVLDATTSNASYLWSNGSINAQLTVTTTGIFWVHATTNTGCGIDSIQINYQYPLPTSFLGQDTALCDGEILIIDAFVANGNYNWSNGETNSVISITEEGKYWVSLNNHCITATDTIEVDFKTTPFFELGNDTTICKDRELILSVETYTGAFIYWNNFSTKNTYIVTNAGKYWATARLGDCDFRDTINVSYRDECLILFVPNVFTPNADGINDVFTVKVIGSKDYTMSIFNRWGTLVYTSQNNNEIGWDGRQLTGKESENGVYFWIINGMTEEGQNFQRKGEIHLFK